MFIPVFASVHHHVVLQPWITCPFNVHPCICQCSPSCGATTLNHLPFQWSSLYLPVFTIVWCYNLESLALSMIIPVFASVHYHVVLQPWITCPFNDHPCICQCSPSCGAGFVVRSVYCLAEDGSQLPEEKCGRKPRTRKACKNAKPCGGIWFEGPWSEVLVTSISRELDTNYVSVCLKLCYFCCF